MKDDVYFMKLKFSLQFNSVMLNVVSTLLGKNLLRNNISYLFSLIMFIINIISTRDEQYGEGKHLQIFTHISIACIFQSISINDKNVYLLWCKINIFY